MPPRACWFGLMVVLLVDSAVWAVAVSTFDDITFWTGAGENRAAIVIDWNHASADDESLVWGFRWTGEASGEDLLRTVVQADSRLFLRHGTSAGFGLPVYGLGYDLNHDSTFAITDNTRFDEQGLAETSTPDPPPQLPAVSADPDDNYAEGFFTGFWHYANSVGDPFAGGSWLSGAAGLSSRQLDDGDWDGWTFETPANVVSTAFAENPISAEAPFSADFDGDGDVDGADLLTWQRGFGILPDARFAQGDANGDHHVDQLDLRIWSAAFGNSAALNTVIAIPEPDGFSFLVAAIFTFFGTSRTPRRSLS